MLAAYYFFIADAESVVMLPNPHRSVSAPHLRSEIRDPPAAGLHRLGAFVVLS